MTHRGDASQNGNHEDDEKKGHDQEPDVVPLDYPSAEQKAQTRGRWVKEAILKGAASGAVRVALQEMVDRLDF